MAPPTAADALSDVADRAGPQRMSEHDHVTATGTRAPCRRAVLADDHLAIHAQRFGGPGHRPPQGPGVASQFDQDSENEPFPDDDLFDIDDVRVVLGQRGEERRRDAGALSPSGRDEDRRWSHYLHRSSGSDTTSAVEVSCRDGYPADGHVSRRPDCSQPAHGAGRHALRRPAAPAGAGSGTRRRAAPIGSRGIDVKLCRGGGQEVAHSSELPWPHGSSAVTTSP